MTKAWASNCASRSDGKCEDVVHNIIDEITFA